jgi:hypothetical protein
MVDKERQEARPADTRLLPGHCHKCGCPRVDNPHPDAGKPGRYLEVGCEKECLPCTVLSRHQWYQRAVKAEKELRELKVQKLQSIVDEQFTRAWIDLANLPGGMMHSSQVGHFGPVPASTSCWITTSEAEAARMSRDGPVLEIFTHPAKSATEPIYQVFVRCLKVYVDTTKEAYDNNPPDQRRIVYIEPKEEA